MSSGFELLAAGAGVGLGHAILPDHWLPLAVVARSERLPARRVLRLSTLAGLTHVGVSVLLGGLIIAIGLPFRSQVESAEATIVGLLLLITGLGFAALELTGHGHSHSHDHDHPGHRHGHHGGHAAGGGGLRSVASVIVPFGAAASPDLTILPVFLAATLAGAVAATLTVVVFALVTIATMVGLTLAAAVGALSVRARWLDRSGNAITAGVLVVIGALVLAGVL